MLEQISDHEMVRKVVSYPLSVVNCQLLVESCEMLVESCLLKLGIKGRLTAKKKIYTSGVVSSTTRGRIRR